MDKPLIDNNFVLEKFPGKGGWTYALLPEILQNKQAPFGWVRVKGTIDTIAFKGYHLMPMKNGKLFLPVKAALRKKINKQAGDSVRVVLYADELPTEIPEEVKLCLLDEPTAYTAFLSCTEEEQKAFIKWIYSAKTDEEKVDRIANTINTLVRKKK